MARLKITSFDNETNIIYLKDKLNRYTAKLKSVRKLYNDGSIEAELDDNEIIRCDTIIPVEKLIKNAIKDYRTIRIKAEPKQVKLCDAKEVSSKLYIAESTLRRWTDEEVRQHGYIRLGYLKNKLIYVEND
jgi:hypothetical protein